MTNAYRIEANGDPILQEDLEIIAGDNGRFRALAGSSLLITGATGLVGSQLARALACYNRVHHAGMTIYLLVRSREKAEDIFGALLQRGDVVILTGDVTDPFRDYFPDDLTLDYIIHAASVTASKQMVEKPAETIRISLEGTRQMLELAKQHGVRSMIYISSMEMYGTVDFDRPVTENDLGYIDPLRVRSNYPESKRMCENMCVAYHAEYGVPVRIARLSQTFGAGILRGENRVFAQFARSAISGQDIVLHTAGRSEGNYCYTRDTIRGLLTILLHGADAEAYNVANEACHTTIAAMAQLVAGQIAASPIRVVFDIPESNTFGYAPDTKLKLSSAKLRALGWEPEVGLVEAYRRMIASMTWQQAE